MVVARTYGRLKLSGDDWVMHDVEPHVSIRLKQLFPQIGKASTCPYRFKRTMTVDADLDWFMQRYPMLMTEVDRGSLLLGVTDYGQQKAELERILRPDYTTDQRIALKPGQVLRHYQLQAIDIARRKGSLLLGDEGGLGKTYTAAGFMVAERGALPAAVVCDAHMQRQWKDKIESFTSLRVHLIKKGSPYNLPRADVYVFRVTQASGWVNFFETVFFKSVIYDEPQSLRNGTGTQKGMACKVLSRHAKFRLGLTATPVYNYGNEMWHIMQFIDPAVLGAWDDFSREWCTPIGNNKYRIVNPKALGTYLRDQHAILRRVKGDVGLQLPKVSKIVEHVDYDAKAVAAVEDLARTLAIKATTAAFVERGNAVRELDTMMRQVTGVSKAKAVAMFARMIVESGEPVVIWGWHRDVYDIWNEELHDLEPAMYTGTESAAKKENSLTRFLNGYTDVLIMSLRSGAGVDGLQHRCCTGIFGELDWSPGIHQQCIWRLDREGQTEPVSFFYLVTEDGSDPPMMDVLGIKASEARSIIDPHLGVETNSSDTTHLQKLVHRYLSRKTKAIA